MRHSGRSAKEEDRPSKAVSQSAGDPAKPSPTFELRKSVSVRPMDALVEQVRQQVPELRQPLGKIPGTESTHRGGQNPHGRFEVPPFVALEVLRLNDAPEQVERRRQRLGGGGRLCGKQASEECAARQRFQPGGTLGAAASKAPSSMWRCVRSIQSSRLSGCSSATRSRYLRADVQSPIPRTDEAANSNERQSLAGSSASKAATASAGRPSSINACPHT